MMLVKWQVALLYWLWRRATNIIARRNSQFAMRMYDLAPWEQDDKAG